MAFLKKKWESPEKLMSSWNEACRKGVWKQAPVRIGFGSSPNLLRGMGGTNVNLCYKIFNA